MSEPTQAEQVLLEKIHNLPAEKVGEVVDFVEFLLERQSEINDRCLVNSAAAMSAAAFGIVWDNPEDDVYSDI